MKHMISLCLGTLLVLIGCSSGGGEGTPEPDTSVADTSQSVDQGTAVDTSFVVEDVSVSEDTGGLASDIIDGPVCEGFFVQSFKGFVQFEDGTGALGAKAQICVLSAKTGSLACLQPSDVAEDGSFELLVPSSSSCIATATGRMVMTPTYCSDDNECDGVACVPQRYADGGVCHVGHAVMYCDAAMVPEVPDVVLTEPYILHSLNLPQTLPPLGDEEEVRTVVFADGLEMDFRPFDIFASGGGYNALASRYFTPDTPGFCHTESAPVEFDGLYGFSPESNIIGPGNFPTRIPNRDNAAPGTEYDLYILGGLQCQLQDRSHVGETEWKQFAKGVVNAEGTFIETLEDQGLPCLNWLAYRLSAE